jgi:parallel beta-helix repeat protein
MLICLNPVLLTGDFKVKAYAQGQTRYVDAQAGEGYTKIQDAINDSSDGDTVFVNDSTYNENIIIDVSINLTGESDNLTVIDGGENGTTITISVDGVNISNFTIKNCGEDINDSGIKIQSNYTKVTNNIIKDCKGLGIFLDNANHNSFINNTFSNISNISAIFLSNSSSNNTVVNNNFTNCLYAIAINDNSCFNNISSNHISNNDYGISLSDNTTLNNILINNSVNNMTCYGLRIEHAGNNKITKNILRENNIGIHIFGVNNSYKNIIYHNNFINNTDHFVDECNQSWNDSYPSGGNFWDDHIFEDVLSGQNQSINGSDGICDLAYFVYNNYTYDHYPLMQQWGKYAPIAQFVYSVAGKTISFNASNSYDRDGSIQSYEWEFGDGGNGTGEIVNHTYSQNGTYKINLTVNDNEGKNDTFEKYIFLGNDTNAPEILFVSNTPNTLGYGFNVTITANITDDFSGVKEAIVNVSYPDNCTNNFTMILTNGSVYEYFFDDTWKNGKFNYTIEVIDYAGNTNISSINNFNTSAQVNVTIFTIKDEFSDNEMINITDPPVISSGDTTYWNEIGYKLIENNDVLHIWNKYDSYYFDTNSGIQLTNHYQEYWSHNVLMLGYYNNDKWNLIYRTDELSGFNKDVDSDNETFVNATLWKDLTYKGYDFRLAIRYNLGVDDNELTVIPYIKNLDDNNIPYTLGFGWEMKDIQIDMTQTGDYINVNKSMYYLNQTLDNTYSDLSESEFYLMENISNSSTKSLYLKWNSTLNYKLQVKSRNGQYNAPVTLFVRIGTLNSGQEKYTKMYWYDAYQLTYYFDRYDNNEAWASNPNNMVDGNTGSHASTTINSDIELCDSNTCQGSDIGNISKVEIRASGYYSGSKRDIILRPVFNGTADGMNYDYNTNNGAGPIWSQYFDITIDPSAPLSWDWDDVDNLDCDVEAGPGPFPFTLYCSKVELRVTYTPYTPPDISNPYPINGGIGIPITPLLNITVNDVNGDTMNITWLSNSSGSWQVFGTNTSVSNGIYHQVFSNSTQNYSWYFWRVNVSDGMYYTLSDIYKFYTGVCQSKMNNTGLTNVSGYLFMQIHYYNESSNCWVNDNTTLDETVLRTINIGEEFGLDTVFNGLIDTWDLKNGNGTYRVYAAFRDPYGNVLLNDDLTSMDASFNFTVSLSLDSDSDGLIDYEELNALFTNVQSTDTDNDGFVDAIDIDPTTDLKIIFTSKRIYSSKYTYTWREGESWNYSKTKTSGNGDGTEWLIIESNDASNGNYTRQNDSRDGIEDYAYWNFTVRSTGLFHIWIRSHRYENASSSVHLWWIDETDTPIRIYNRGSDHSKYGTEPLWFQNTTGNEGEWKWSWYGVVDIEETGDYTLKINNTEVYEDELGYHHGDPAGWMEVDNILITDDSMCIPSGKGIEGSTDCTIGDDSDSSWDPPGADSAPDFYLKVTVADSTEESDDWENDFDVLEDWSHTFDVDDDEEDVPITIELWEEDGATDTLCDINGSSIFSKKINITYNLKTGTWSGDDYLGDTNNIGRVCGEADGDFNPSNDANVIFDIDQTDGDNDGITYYREIEVFKAGEEGSEPFKPGTTNDRFAVIIGGGASCKVKEESNDGSSDPTSGPHYIFNNGDAWEDYTLQADVSSRDFIEISGYPLSPDLDKECIGLLFRYDDDNNYYMLRWKKIGAGWRSKIFLDKVYNGVHSTLKTKRFIRLENKEWYTIKIQVNNDESDNVNIILWINNNKKDNFKKILTYTDTSNTITKGGVGFYSWKNRGAWFDDVFVNNSDEDCILTEGFDYSIIPSSTWSEIGDGDWSVTPWSTDQEEMYKELDFLYRELLLNFHYDKEKIKYLSAHRWRDPDGDGDYTDADNLSVKPRIKDAIKKWLKTKSNSDDLNFIFTITHGYYKKNKDYSYNCFDNNRDGNCINDIFTNLKDKNVKKWLEKHKYGENIGRLVFLIDSCFSGHYCNALDVENEERIIIASSSKWEPAELETGQDWGAFSGKFFNELANGKTNIAEAYNVADKHVNITNFMSTWIIKKWGYRMYNQNGSLDDNGNGLGSDWDLPNDGSWNNIYKGSYPNRIMKKVSIPQINEDYSVKKIRFSFHVRRGVWPSVTAKLYEVRLHDSKTGVWKSPDGHFDQWGFWENEGNTYDDNVFSKSTCTIDGNTNIDPKFDSGTLPFPENRQFLWTPCLTLELNLPIHCDKIKFRAAHNRIYCNKIEIDVFYEGYSEGLLAEKTGL